MKNILHITFLVFCYFIIHTQEYLGAGELNGIKVTTSHNFNGSDGYKTIDGSGMDAKLMSASRFLYQAGFGADYETIVDMASTGDYESWVNNQFNLEPTLILPKLRQINEETFLLFISRDDDGDGNLNEPEDYFGPWVLHFSYAWWDNVKKVPDQLRYKIAHALSQILVVSANSDLRDHGEALADYYDIFLRHAFGNYKDILREVSLHPAMGYYLSHLNNPKTNEDRNQHPDENYAREIMQLFTIGLYELNIDGSRMTDSNGDFIPTYTNNDIKELAKVFTGLGGGDLNDKIKREYPNAVIEFGSDFYSLNRTIPMKMFEDYHEQGSKIIVGGKVISGSQSGLDDIEEAIDHLFNHHNVGPFIARRLIQRMIKSNPSPEYIGRVASKFNNNGQGVRGDMKAVVMAILMDDEARSCTSILDPIQGKLREPVLRNTHIMNAIMSDSPTGNYWKDPVSGIEATKQAPLSARTVFNFYHPDYQPIGDITDNNLFAPEFQIFDSETSIGYINQTFLWTFYELLMYDWEDETPEVVVVFDKLQELSEDTEELINYLDILFTHGQMTESTKGVIRESLDQLPFPEFKDVRAKLALYVTMISPDYTILK